MKGKIFKEFDESKHVIELSPVLLTSASQPGGVIIATDDGYYKMEKINPKLEDHAK